MTNLLSPISRGPFHPVGFGNKTQCRFSCGLATTYPSFPHHTPAHSTEIHTYPLKTSNSLITWRLFFAKASLSWNIPILYPPTPYSLLFLKVQLLIPVFSPPQYSRGWQTSSRFYYDLPLPVISAFKNMYVYFFLLLNYFTYLHLTSLLS